MINENKTVLRECPAGDPRLPRYYYEIEGKGITGEGEYRHLVYTIEARILSEHYLLTRDKRQPIAIFDMDQREMAEKRMYREAGDLAKIVAGICKSTIVTSSIVKPKSRVPEFGNREDLKIRDRR